MCPQCPLLFRSAEANKESILHVTRRMVRRKVERTEIVMIILHFRSLAHSISDPRKDVDDPLADDRDRMKASCEGTNCGRGKIDRRTLFTSNILYLCFEQIDLFLRSLL